MLDFTVFMRAAEHQKDLQEEATKARMIQTQVTRTSLQERVLLYVGDFLIRAGVWLHRQYEPTESQPCLDLMGE